MKITISALTQSGGTVFLPQPHRLYLGGQNAAGVDTLQFVLPDAWHGRSTALYLQRSDGTRPAPVALDSEGCVTVDRRMTDCTSGQWMLAAVGEGYTAYTRPGSYDTYATLPTDGGEAELPPSQYEQFVARVLESASDAASAAKKASAAQAKAAQYAGQVGDAAAQSKVSCNEAADYAARAEAAAHRAEAFAPSGGEVRSVNGMGGIVTLTAKDVGAVPLDGGYVRSVTQTDNALRIRSGDGTLQVLALPTDTTLSLDGYAADAKTAGEALAAKSDADHTHDARYYTKAQADALLAGKSDTGHVHAAADIIGLAGADAQLHTLAVDGGTPSDDALCLISDGGEGAYTQRSVSTLWGYVQGKAAATPAAAGALSGIAASGDGYVRLTDGTQICWGVCTNAATGTTLRYPVAFAGEPCVVCTRIWSGSTGGESAGVWVYNITARQFTLGAGQSTGGVWAAWLALGRAQ